MAKYKNKNGIYLPIEDVKPVKFIKKESPQQWDCPHCGVFFDSTKQECEEYTVGSLTGSNPHIVCPNCKECMGCEKYDNN